MQDRNAGSQGGSRGKARDARRRSTGRSIFCERMFHVKHFDCDTIRVNAIRMQMKGERHG